MVLITSQICGQGVASSLHAFKILDSASMSLCLGDTTNAIAILERIESSFPTGAVISISNQALAQLYLINRRIADAKQALNYALWYHPTDSVFFVKDREFDKLIRTVRYSSAKADICVLLSKLHLSEYNYDSSLYFLTLAEKQFLPYKDCGNGVNMYHSFLSTFFADHYLAVGDTTKAIVRLLDNLLNLDGDSKFVAQKLKKILLKNLTQREITQELNRARRAITFSKIGEQEFSVSLSFFGYSVKQYASGTISNYKRSFLKSPGFVELRGY